MSFMFSFLRANSLVELVACCLLTVKPNQVVLCTKRATTQNNERIVAVRI